MTRAENKQADMTNRRCPVYFDIAILFSCRVTKPVEYV